MAASAVKMITRSKRGMEHHPSSSHMSGSSTASTLNRKPSASAVSLASPIIESRPVSSIKMPPPLGIPAARTLIKPSSSIVTASKDTVRPKKKLAKEGAVAQVGGSSTRQGAATGSGDAQTHSTPVRTPLAVSRHNSRGNSVSPQAMSPTPFERPTFLRVPAPKAPKKADLNAAPVKSKVLAGGPTQRRLREPTPRASRSDNLQPKTPHHTSGSGSQSRSKVPSKSGVDSSSGAALSSDKGSETGQDSASTALTGIATDFSPENFPPIVHPDRTPELEQEVQNLTSKSADLTSRLADIARENRALVDEMRQLREDKHQLELQNEQLESMNSAMVQERNRIEALYTDVMAQLQTATELHETLETQLNHLSEIHQTTVAESQVDREKILRFTEEITAISQQLVGLEAEKASLISESNSAQARVVELEKSWQKARDDLDTVKKDMVSLKKKNQADNAKAVDQVAELQKLLQAKEQEAESWKVVTELKQSDLKKLQSDMEEARSVIDRHSLCEREISMQLMKIEDLESTIENITITEKKLKTAVKEKDDQLRELHRRSTLLMQEKDTLKYQLDRVAESESGDL